ncbi:glycoside hydrolase family 13 protein [Salinibacterium sp. NK8237]|uniref:glycoside hydrolase family 13 protein n=1 Tax=Salinibacterium sp. NK8237 TaxID=2792038 RepID=UPI0018CD024A|nr:glycoside hydrolase family 13 protein [Salinibacterium sp. NK8237]MBH0130873.1 glycoside hydrolase family 13 protein [Salinibacterium sp. NK8237]
MDALLPHHDGSALHVSTQTPALGDTVTLRLRVPVGYGPLKAVRVRENPDHEPRWTDARLTGTAAGWDWWQADIVVENPRHGYRWLLVHDAAAPAYTVEMKPRHATSGRANAGRGNAGRTEWLNQSGLHPIETLDSEDFALLATPAAPEWLAETVMYQVFPDRFARSSGADSHATPEWAIAARWDEPVDPVLPGRSKQFYGGDLDGITEHLDHLTALGVTMLYLTPIFPARSNHRYDASSFVDVDELLGGREALIRLVGEAHARGLKVIGDLTTNHSGDAHEWFQAALGKPDAPEGDFYYFTNDEHTEYVGWLGTPSLPKFNWNSTELRRRFIEGDDSVVAHWLKEPYNFDGWRVDVANMTGRMGAEDLNEEVRQIIRRTMEDVNPDTVLLAESTNDAASDLQGDAWHGAMTYPSFTRPVWGWLTEPGDTSHVTADGSIDPEAWFFGQPIGGIPNYSARDFSEMTVRFTASIPWRIRLGNMNALDTHDTARFRTHAPAENVPLALALSVTLPGVPVVFAGDEFGLSGDDGEMSRTPIPWGTETDPPVAPTLVVYRQLIALRRELPTLSHGGLRWLHVADDALVFVREDAAATVLVVVARSPLTVTLPTNAFGVELEATGATAAGASGSTESEADVAAPAFLTGNATLTSAAAGLTLSAAARTCAIWTLPGVEQPATSAAR